MTDDTTATADTTMNDTHSSRDNRPVRTDGGTDEQASNDWGSTDHDDSPDRTGSAPEDRAARNRRGGRWAQADLQERLQWIALVVLGIVAVATLFSFYTNVSRFIAIWASRKYEPALQAAFALAVLALSLAGIAALSRNLN